MPLTRHALTLESPIGVGLTPTRRVIDSIDMDFSFVKRMVAAHRIVLDRQATVYLAARENDRRFRGFVDAGPREADQQATLQFATV